MRNTAFPLLSVAFGLLLVGAAEHSAEAAEESKFDVSVTISPVHLILPVAEVMGELRVDDKAGVGLILGGGTIDVQYSFLGSTITKSYPVIEAGLDGHYYLFGNFEHGMQIGAEALYINVDAKATGVVAEGVAFGPYVGYKVATDIGFTFLAQGGVQYVAAVAEETDGTDSEKRKDVIPLLNLNIGWSF